jgi:hypothetical protein
MAVKIIEATDAIEISQIRMLIFGQPGIGKSSIGNTAEEPLSLDFDKGAHRAMNRKRTVSIDAWEDVQELMRMEDFLRKHKTLVLDTVGRCLDVMSVAIIAENSKFGYAGNLSQQGWGVLKGRFRTWMTQLATLGIDVLMLAHDKEDKSGDVKSIRPDIQGGSYGEVLKVADFCGYYAMAGKERTLDFSPTESYVGKNPAGWEPFRVPSFVKSPKFLAGLMVEGRAALGKMSEESAAIASKVADWQTAIADYATVDQVNGAIPGVKALTPPILLEQVKRHLADKAKALGLKADKATGLYVPAEVVPQAQTA